MAGRETSGFGAATADLFVGRPWVVVPGDPADGVAIERVETLVRATGALPVRMDAGTHDAAVAGISHLPLVAAAALVEAVAGVAGEASPSDWPAAAALAASPAAALAAAPAAALAAAQAAALAAAMTTSSMPRSSTKAESR